MMTLSRRWLENGFYTEDTLADGCKDLPVLNTVLQGRSSTVGALLEAFAPRQSQPPAELVEETLRRILEENRVTIRKLKTVSLRDVSTTLVLDIVRGTGFTLSDGVAVAPANDVPTSQDWMFDMGKYECEEDCYEDFFKFMVRYLKEVHNVEIGCEPPYPRGSCRLLDVHSG